MSPGAGRPARGFTLIELLVALAVFAVLAFTVTTRISEIAQQSFVLERRALAQWVADNGIQRLLLERRQAGLNANPEPLPTGQRTERVVFGGRDWQVRTRFVSTSDPSLARAELEVFELGANGDESGPIYSMNAFLGQY